LIATLVGVALKTRRRVVTGGPGDLIGSVAEVLDDTQADGWALVRGETWRITSDTPLRRAQKVLVIARKGLLLKVTPAGNHEKGE
jgi:membrane-bound serine protease (ClpP class)